jgi:hypothetical protein
MLRTFAPNNARIICEGEVALKREMRNANTIQPENLQGRYY